MGNSSSSTSERISDTLRKLNAGGMQNGGITKFRILASGVIGLIGLVGGVFLLYHQIVVPDLFWYIIIGALGGVVGLDLLASIIKSIKGQ